MNRFRRLDDGRWGLACEERYERGEEVLVERKDGTTDMVKVGEYLGMNDFGDYLHRIWNQGNDRAASAPQPAPAPAPASAAKNLPDDEIPF